MNSKLKQRAMTMNDAQHVCETFLVCIWTIETSEAEDELKEIGVLIDESISTIDVEFSLLSLHASLIRQETSRKRVKFTTEFLKRKITEWVEECSSSLYDVCRVWSSLRVWHLSLHMTTARIVEPRPTFQQDPAPSHKAKLTKNLHFNFEWLWALGTGQPDPLDYLRDFNLNTSFVRWSLAVWRKENRNVRTWKLKDNRHSCAFIAIGFAFKLRWRLTFSVKQILWFLLSTPNHSRTFRLHCGSRLTPIVVKHDEKWWMATVHCYC